MSYVVLARRYRPQCFGDVIGQDHISKTLLNAISSARTHHAYLFSGPRGTGKTSSARILAKALRCLNPQKNGEPCNKCEACTSINDGNSMDVIEIDAASNNGVDNIRDLRENVGFAATIGKYRIYIVDEVHMLSTAAFNALLKTLEEPPPHIVFILATTELHKVPATVQSRCQRFDFKKVAPLVLIGHLKEICQTEKIKIDESSLQLIVGESEGCVRDALSLLDRAIALCGKEIQIDTLTSTLGLMDRKAFRDLVEAIASHDPSNALKKSTALMDQGVDPKILLSRLVDFWRDLHFYYFTSSCENSDPAYLESLKSLSQKLSVDEIIRALDLSLRTQGSLTSSDNAQMTVESFVVKLSLQRPIATQNLQPQQNYQAPTSSSVNPPQSHSRSPSTSTTAPSAQNMKSSESPSPSSTPTPRSSSRSSSQYVEQFENFIRTNKPAWTPVLQSLIELNIQGDSLHAKARGDFAGKRLASADGIEILKRAFGVKQAKVDLESSSTLTPAQQGPSHEEKKQLAKEDESVQAALKIFSGSQISESKVLESPKGPNRR